MNDIISVARQEMIDSLAKLMVTPNLKKTTFSEDDENKYKCLIKDVKSGKDAEVQLPLEFAIRDELFNLIKSHTVFIKSNIKFIATFTTRRPVISSICKLETVYSGNEFYYSFLDNHPGIINIDRLSDIPSDYEGLMAVPTTILEYKNIIRFNIHRVIYDPIYDGKRIYSRVVISNKVIISD